MEEEIVKKRAFLDFIIIVSKMIFRKKFFLVTNMIILAVILFIIVQYRTSTCYTCQRTLLSTINTIATLALIPFNLYFTLLLHELFHFIVIDSDVKIVSSGEEICLQPLAEARFSRIFASAILGNMVPPFVGLIIFLTFKDFILSLPYFLGLTLLPKDLLSLIMEAPEGD